MELLCFLFQSESGSQIAKRANHSKSTEFFFFFFKFIFGSLLLCAGFLSSCCVRASHCVASLVTKHGPRTCGPSCPVGWGIFPDQGLNLCPLNWQVDS